MILVTGAAGKTGRAVLRALAARHAETRALIRAGHQAAAVRQAGAQQIFEGDLLDPHALARAVEGIRVIYHICPNVSPHEIEIGHGVIDAAHRAGVEHIVFHSVLHPQTEAMPHHWRKLRVEEALLESGLSCTFLRPAAYMQNLLPQLPTLRSEGILRIPYPASTRIALVDLEDVAEVAAAVATHPANHCGASYDLSSGEAPDQRAVADLLAEILDRPIQVEEVPLDQWRQQALASGLDAERCDTLEAMFRYYARHGFVGPGNVLGWILDRPPHGLRDVLERAQSSP